MTVGSSLMYTKAATTATILIILKSQAWDQWKVNRRLLRQFIQCCSGPPKDSRFVQPTTVYETPQAVSTCFDGSSSAVRKRNTHGATCLRNCVQQLVYIVGLRTLSVADFCRRQFWILSQFLLCAFFVCKQSRNRLATCLSP